MIVPHGAAGQIIITDAYSSRCRPALLGSRSAVSAAHPLAAAAAQDVLGAGGGAADAVIAAHAMISVLMPEAGGLGGDGFFLVREPGGLVTAVNAAGRSSANACGTISDDGTSVTVPGLVAGWGNLSARFGRLPLSRALAPAVDVAKHGCHMRLETARALASQRERLVRGGAQTWPYFAARRGSGGGIVQPALAATLQAIGADGCRWFYEGPLGRAVERPVQARRGALDAADMARHVSVIVPPLTLSWFGVRVHVQPPMSQGVLLAMALKAFANIDVPEPERDHVAIELTHAAFAFRDEAELGEALLHERLTIDIERAGGRGGPRSYLHTAGVAAADADGFVVSSLLSVFDDFGSAIYVPEGGFVLNNRGASFTDPPNEAADNKLPVHTLAPILVETENSAFALATPGADGQVQTLLQILLSVFVGGADLAIAIDQPRWRSEDGRLLLEAGHQKGEELTSRGHRVLGLPAGDTRFGGVVCAGIDRERVFALSDWRRENWSAVG